ncbi:hypothetical protein CLAIMM_04389 isoform 2 [Cladophialophora immunda]|nr:hypothetical protein CLAIMM_04389 isoform 2 [Cladophialophora immunda]
MPEGGMRSQELIVRHGGKGLEHHIGTDRVVSGGIRGRAIHAYARKVGSCICAWHGVHDGSARVSELRTGIGVVIDDTNTNMAMRTVICSTQGIELGEWKLSRCQRSYKSSRG